MFLSFLSKYREGGLLLIRIGLAVTFVCNSRELMFGGPAKWQQLGHAMSYVGIHGWFGFWGFMAAFSQFFGSILICIGFCFRPACILLAITMTVAAIMHIKSGDGFMKASPAINMAVVFYGLTLVGAGKYSVDKS